MRTPFAAAVLVAGLACAACSSQQLADAQSTLNGIDKNLLATANAACALAAPVAAAASAAPNATVKNLTAYITGTCDLASGQVAPAALPNVDSNTAAWLGAIVGAAKVLVSTPIAAPAKAP